MDVTGLQSSAVSILSISLALVSIILAIMFYRRSRRIKRLDVVISKPIPLLARRPEVTERLRIEYEGTPIKAPHICRITAACTGNASISGKDIQDFPLVISVAADDTKPIDCRVTGGQEFVTVLPPGASGACYQLQLKALSPGDSFSILLITDGDPDRRVSVGGKILDGDLRIVTSPGQSYIQECLSAVMRIVALALPLSGTLYMTSWLILKNVFKAYGPKLTSVNVTTSVIIGVLVSIIIVKIALAGKRHATALERA
jgi:hypothetical protein